MRRGLVGFIEGVTCVENSSRHQMIGHPFAPAMKLTENNLANFVRNAIKIDGETRIVNWAHRWTGSSLSKWKMRPTLSKKFSVVSTRKNKKENGIKLRKYFTCTKVRGDHQKRRKKRYRCVIAGQPKASTEKIIVLKSFNLRNDLSIWQCEIVARKERKRKRKKNSHSKAINNMSLSDSNKAISEREGKRMDEKRQNVGHNKSQKQNSQTEQMNKQTKRNGIEKKS